jgi:hypothetical protein
MKARTWGGKKNAAHTDAIGTRKGIKGKTRKI